MTKLKRIALPLLTGLCACAGTAQDRVATGGNALAALLPDRAGFVWRYNGFAEYGATIRLAEVRQSGTRVNLAADVEVDDMSAGESGKPASFWNFRIACEVTPEALIQKGLRGPLLDADFPTLELARLPLAAGTRWTQTAVDTDGRTHVLDCAITNETTSFGRRAWQITYTSRDGSKHEWREIAVGMGIVAFAKKWQDTIIGFGLYEDQSGYGKGRGDNP